MGFGALLAIGGGPGCVDEREPLTNVPPSCKAGLPCSGSTGGMGSGSSSSGGGGDAGTGAESVTGSLVRLADDEFLQTSSYVGPAQIRAARAGGGVVEAAYEDGSFKLSDVAIGEGVLFQIRDAAPGAPEILSTFNYRDVTGPNDSVTLVAANEEVLGSLALCLGIPLDPASAHAILRVVRDGSPLAGAALTDDGSVGVVAYEDIAADPLCSYTLGGPSTGPNGVALLFNIPVPDNGRLSLEVSDGANPYAGLLDVAKGTVTFADLSL
jgi:hypothetical protein